MLVVLFGLFHGLVYLPVILSWWGPEPYPSAQQSGNQSPDSTMDTSEQAAMLPVCHHDNTDNTDGAPQKNGYTQKENNAATKV